MALASSDNSLDWNTLAAFAMGVLAAVIPSALVAHWQARSAEASDQRAASRRRRESRIRPVEELLEVARAYRGGEDAIDLMVEALRKGRAEDSTWVDDELVRELERTRAEAVTEAGLIAETSKALLAAPTQEVRTAILALASALVENQEGDWLSRTVERAQELEDSIDAYLA